jgi:hypothetical protein
MDNPNMNDNDPSCPPEPSEAVYTKPNVRDKMNIIWHHYLVDESSKTTKSNRYTVKCVYCGKVFDGRLLRMQSHTMNKCTEVPLEVRETLILDAESAAAAIVAACATRPTVKPSTALSSLSKAHMAMKQYYEKAKLSRDDEEQYAVAVLKFFIACKIPMTTLDSPYFKDMFQTIKPSWDVPSRATFKNEYMGKALINMIDEMDPEDPPPPPPPHRPESAETTTLEEHPPVPPPPPEDVDKTTKRKHAATTTTTNDDDDDDDAKDDEDDIDDGCDTPAAVSVAATTHVAVADYVVVRRWKKSPHG